MSEADGKDKTDWFSKGRRVSSEAGAGCPGSDFGKIAGVQSPGSACGLRKA